MGEDIATFDIDRKEITAQMLRNIEHKANRAVYDAIPVEVSFVESAEDARRYPLRKPLSVDEDILIVTVKGVDCVACCCPPSFRYVPRSASSSFFARRSTRE